MSGHGNEVKARLGISWSFGTWGDSSFPFVGTEEGSCRQRGGAGKHGMHGRSELSDWMWSQKATAPATNCVFASRLLQVRQIHFLDSCLPLSNSSRQAWSMLTSSCPMCKLSLLLSGKSHATLFLIVLAGKSKGDYSCKSTPPCECAIQALQMILQYKSKQMWPFCLMWSKIQVNSETRQHHKRLVLRKINPRLL